MDFGQIFELIRISEVSTGFKWFMEMEKGLKRIIQPLAQTWPSGLAYAATWPTVGPAKMVWQPAHTTVRGLARSA
jgi:hypothetical protein